MSTIKRAVIIGGGPAGLISALRLKRENGIDSTVYEIREKPSTIGGAINIPPNGIRLFNELGLYDALNARAASVSLLTVTSATQGSSPIEHEMGESCKKATGFGVWRVLRSDLIDVLMDAVEREKILVLFGKKLTDVIETKETVKVIFADGTDDSADILLGCDGIHSAVRKLHVDPRVEPEYSGVSNMFAILPSTALSFPPDAKPTMRMSFSSDGLFSVIPCTASSDYLYWFFSRKVEMPKDGGSRDGWEAFGKKDVENLKSGLFDTLKSVAGEWGNALRGLISATETIKFYPIYKMSSSCQWFTGRSILLGDAAHAMPPHLGQGTSMALEDVFLLSRLLESQPIELADAFSLYEKIRRPRIERISQGAVRSGNLRTKMDSTMSQTREETLAAQWRDKSRMDDYSYNIIETKL
ncbi:hypothetical protein N7466_010299 [Penicillium verhagenii]|uniref:uncharacterized protein n=1 Tax=Penicillium verhagenii TaxID=1562060 RepID=UPI00254568C1|nr:uncharacterized protein N7466_010299 [Penicillium verhagenii]KAJ5919356.1 hypothetical protein N7466_010299 [Penicillium verhagenii]